MWNPSCRRVLLETTSKAAVLKHFPSADMWKHWSDTSTLLILGRIKMPGESLAPLSLWCQHSVSSSGTPWLDQTGYMSPVFMNPAPPCRSLGKKSYWFCWGLIWAWERWLGLSGLHIPARRTPWHIMECHITRLIFVCLPYWDKECAMEKVSVFPSF